jgi:predicted ester cyclase
MTREETTALFARRQDASNRHDVAGLTPLFADDCVVESPTAGGVVQGLPTVDAINRSWVTGFPDVVFTTEDLLIDGNHVAWIVRAAGTDTGGFMGLPPTGRAFEVPMVMLATLNDRHIVHERRIYDFTGMLVQIGILKAKATGSMAPLAPFGAPAFESARPSEADGVSSTTREDTVHLLARRDEAWGRHDVALLAEQHADTCVMDSHLAGSVTGRAAIRQVYEAWFAAFPDSSMIRERVLIDDERVAEVAMQSGTDTGGFLGLPPTGKPFRLPVVWLFTVRHGQFVYVRPIYDFTGMLVLIGVLKAKPA